MIRTIKTATNGTRVIFRNRLLAFIRTPFLDLLFNACG
jgi:hypothetical protein